MQLYHRSHVWTYIMIFIMRSPAPLPGFNLENCPMEEGGGGGGGGATGGN